MTAFLVKIKAPYVEVLGKMKFYNDLYTSNLPSYIIENEDKLMCGKVYQIIHLLREMNHYKTSTKLPEHYTKAQIQKLNDLFGELPYDISLFDQYWTIELFDEAYDFLDEIHRMTWQKLHTFSPEKQATFIDAEDRFFPKYYDNRTVAIRPKPEYLDVLDGLNFFAKPLTCDYMAQADRPRRYRDKIAESAHVFLALVHEQRLKLEAESVHLPDGGKAIRGLMQNLFGDPVVFNEGPAELTIFELPAYPAEVFYKWWTIESIPSSWGEKSDSNDLEPHLFKDLTLKNVNPVVKRWVNELIEKG